MIKSEEPEAPAYTPDTSKTVISFNKENGFFTISGAGKFIVSGMEADLTFTAADTYTVAEDCAVTAANTANALAYTVTMFGQSEEAKATPVTSIVKDGDNYKVTLTATVNGQTLTLAEGTVSADDVIKSEEPEAPAITYSSAAESITFNAEGKSFSANGSGTLSAMGMDMAITFTLNDSYAVAEDGTVTATNTPGALSYSVLGTPGSSNPITSITQSGDSYRIVISTEIAGFGIVTLLDETVNASNVVVSEVASVSEEEVLEEDGVEENSEEILAEEETDSEDPAITGTQDDQAEENPDDSVSDGAEFPDTENDSDAAEEVTDTTESSEADSAITENSTDTATPDGAESENDATEEVTDTTESSETKSDSATTEETTDTTTSGGAESENDATEEVTDTTESSETDSATTVETTDTTASEETVSEDTVPEESDVSTEVE